MTKYNLEQEFSLAREQLKAIDLNRLQNSKLRKDPRELEQAYVYPGPLPYENRTSLEEIFSEENLSHIAGMPIKLYVHLPFCERRCTYCFYETDIGVSAAGIDDYLKALILELDAVLGNLNEGNLKESMVGSKGKPWTSLIYLGGGTPNYLSPRQTDFLLTSIGNRLERLPQSILSVENHPHLITEEHAEVYAQHKINRVSLGMQSFVDKVQERVGRFQSNERAIAGYQIIRNCPSVREINLDVIHGLPGQTLGNWLTTLEKLVELKPEEATIYHFKLHPNSPFFHQQDLELPPLEQVLLERLLSLNILKREGYVLTRPHHHKLGGKSQIGYVRVPGMEIGGTGIGFQIGIGCSAYSHIGQFTSHNLQRREEYMEAVSKGEGPFLRGKRLDDYERKILSIIGNLCSEGRISKTHYYMMFDEQERPKLRQIAADLTNLGLIETRGDLLKLTNPAGILWYEEIARQFYPEEMERIFLRETGREK